MGADDQPTVSNSTLPEGEGEVDLGERKPNFAGRNVVAAKILASQYTRGELFLLWIRPQLIPLFFRYRKANSRDSMRLFGDCPYVLQFNLSHFLV